MNTKIELGKSNDAGVNAESDTNASAVENIEPINPQWLRHRLSDRDNPWHPSLERSIRERVISGKDVRLIRERCGYLPEEFAEYLRKQDAPINSAQSVCRLEQQQEVPLRYVIELKRMVGVENFQQSIREVGLREEYAVWMEKSRKAQACVAERRARQMGAEKEPAKQQATGERATRKHLGAKRRV